MRNVKFLIFFCFFFINIVILQIIQYTTINISRINLSNKSLLVSNHKQINVSSSAIIDDNDIQNDSSPLIEFLLRKYESYVNGGKRPFHCIIQTSVGGFGNSLRGFFNVLVFSMFTDAIILVETGIGNYHVGNMLDYLAIRNEKLQKYFRYENHTNEKWFDNCDFGDRKPCAETIGYKQLVFNDKRVNDLVEKSYRMKYFNIDGPGAHSCDQKNCHFLRNDELFEEFTNFFRINEKNDHSNDNIAMINVANNLYLPHLINSEGKMNFLCNELKLCNGFENWLNRLYENPSRSVTEFGYNYVSSRLIGNIFRELFMVNPRLKDKFDLVLNSIEGKLISIHIRATWMGSGVDELHHSPGYDAYVNCLKQILKNVEEPVITVYIASDSEVPKNIRNMISNCDARKSITVLTQLDFHEKIGHYKRDFFHAINDEEIAISTVFDFVMMGRADISIGFFGSSFTQMSTAMGKSFPPYLIFNRKYQNSFNIGSCIRTRLYSYGANRASAERVNKNRWVLEFNEDEFD